jgi:hypothetical protein
MRAEIRMGEMLKETERAKGGNPNLPTHTHREQVEPTLKELGLTRKEASNAQMLASIPRRR